MVDGEASASSGAPASSSHVPVHLEPPPNVVPDIIAFLNVLSDRPRLQSMQRTKITWAPCRKLTGNQAPWAGNFGDLIKADQQVLSEEGESRYNFRHAIVAALDWCVLAVQS